MREYFDVESLAQEVGVSERTVRRWIDDAVNPLPSHAVRTGGRDRGRVLILRSEFDAWVKRFAPARATDTAMDERVAAAVVRSMRG